MTARLTKNRIWQMSYGLDERSLAVVSTLAKVKVASVRQLQALHFPNQARTCRRVLKELSERRIMARLAGRSVGGVRGGSAGHVFALDVVGQSLAANGKGPRRFRRPWIPGIRFLDHALAVTDVYVAARELERAGVLEVLEFEGEPEAWRTFSSLGTPATLKPDAFLRVGFTEHEDSFFVEVDRGGESLRTIEIKGEAYWGYYQSGEEQHRHGVFPKVLWLVPDEQRRDNVADRLRGTVKEDVQLHEVILASDLKPFLEAQG